MQILDTEKGEFVKNITRFYYDFHWEYERVIGCVINDPLAVAYFLNRELCSGFEAYTTVETEGISIGQSVVDAMSFWKKEENSIVLTEVDEKEFMVMFLHSSFWENQSRRSEQSCDRLWLRRRRKMKKLTVVQVCFIALSAVINIIGGNLALVLRAFRFIWTVSGHFWHRRCLVQLEEFLPGWSAV